MCMFVGLMNTEVVRIHTEHPDFGIIEQAASLVDGGGLVAFPTETVYGLACRVSPDTLARLDRVKQRESEKYYTLHIANKNDLQRYVPDVGIQARKLVERAWPGPLTIVFGLSEQGLAFQRTKLEAEVFENLYRGSSMGVRCPDNQIASMLLEHSRRSIVAPSANVGGRQPATDAEGVVAQLSGLVDLVLDGGPCKYGKSSTVVKSGPGGLQVLREGVLSEQQVRAMAQVRFLIVCTGNTCRSPMAAGFLSKYLAEKLGCPLDRLDEVGYKVASTGVIEPEGRPATPEAVRACAAKGIDIRAHKSRLLTKQLVEESDFIYAMCRMHRQQVIRLSGEAEKKCVLLAGNEEIPDPIGQPQKVYDDCAELIERAVRERISELVI